MCWLRFCLILHASSVLDIYIYIYIFIFYLHQISARVSCIPPLNSELIGSLIGGKRSDLSCIGGHSVKSDLMSFKSLGI